MIPARQRRRPSTPLVIKRGAVPGYSYRTPGGCSRGTCRAYWLVCSHWLALRSLCVRIDPEQENVQGAAVLFSRSFTTPVERGKRRLGSWHATVAPAKFPLIARTGRCGTADETEGNLHRGSKRAVWWWVEFAPRFALEIGSDRLLDRRRQRLFLLPVSPRRKGTGPDQMLR